MVHGKYEYLYVFVNVICLVFLVVCVTRICSLFALCMYIMSVWLYIILYISVSVCLSVYVEQLHGFLLFNICCDTWHCSVIVSIEPSCLGANVSNRSVFVCVCMDPTLYFSVG